MERQVGTTSQIIQVYIPNSSTGLGRTGLAFGTSGLTCYYKRNTGAGSVAVTLATMTLGTWATGGFIEVDATNMPGLYEIGIPNAALITGADLVTLYLQGAANMGAVAIEVELTAWSNQDGVRAGLTALPNAAAGANGGLPTGDASGRVTYAPGEMQVKKNTAFNNFAFYLVQSSDHVTPKLGATVTAVRSIDGGALGACANAVTELGSGFYLINLANTDLNGGIINFLFTATGADARPITIIPQA